MARGKHSQLGEGGSLVKGMEETSGSNKKGKILQTNIHTFPEGSGGK